MQTFWISKYALIDGIISIEGYPSDAFPDLIQTKTDACYPSLVLGKEIHNTFEEAVQHAEKRKENRIKILENEIAQLEALKFNNPTMKPEDCKQLIQEITEQMRHNYATFAKNRDAHRKQIKNIQCSCSHPSTTYCPDASGNNDSSYVCDFCGFEKRRF